MIIKNKISYFKKLKIFCIVATPRSGSDYFQSLLDGHPEVMTFNGSVCLYTEFFYKINFKDSSQKNIIYSIKKFIKSYSTLLCTQYDKDEGKNKMGKNKDEYIDIDFNKYENSMLSYLLSEGFTKKNFYLAVYFSYNFCLGYNFKNKKILLMHPHNFDEVNIFSKDFTKSHYIYMIRDPRAAYLSSIYNLSKRYPNKYYNLRHHFITMYLCLLHSNHGKKLGLKYLCIRLEDLPRTDILRKISKLLKIKFNKSLLNSTFAGKIWNGDSKSKKSYKNHWTINRTYNDWSNKLNNKDKLILNYLFFPALKHYNYKSTKINFLDRIKCFMLIFFPLQFEVEVLKKNISPASFKKKKVKIIFEITQNLYFFGRRIIISVKYYFLNIFSINKNKSKYIRA